MSHEMAVEVGGGAVNLKKRTLKSQERGSVVDPERTLDELFSMTGNSTLETLVNGNNNP